MERLSGRAAVRRLQRLAEVVRRSVGGPGGLPRPDWGR
jgi:hypothetical protein